MKNETIASRHTHGRSGIPILLLVCVAFLGEAVPAQTIRVDTTAGRAIRFDPDQALGSSMDILPANLVDKDLQRAAYVSSTDPWHTAADIESSRDQTGLDLFFTSGITNKLPAMIPVSLLYGTPEDSASEIAYIEKRGYPVSYVEIGEEPDGKNTSPEDYGALYLQWATALHRIDPKLKLGGPVFEGVNEDIRVWPDAQGKTSWLGRFIDYLKEHGRMQDRAFVSFEHYPFPPCEINWTDLHREPELVKHILQVWRDDGVPVNVPLD